MYDGRIVTVVLHVFRDFEPSEPLRSVALKLSL